MSRLVKDTQLMFGETPIDQIKFNPHSRDDIPQVLQGLQYLYVTPEIQTILFSTLEQLIPSNVSISLGRKGMDLWKIFVLGVLRVNLNWDYDRLHEMVNTHKTIRQMLGHGLWDDEVMYSLQTLKDNVRLLTPELLDKINQIVVNKGHELVKKKEDTPILHGRCDSFVVETDVHYPTDINLLFDAMRTVVRLSSHACAKLGDTDWRQQRYRLRQLKRAFRQTQKTKPTQYKNAARLKANQEKVTRVYTAYIQQAQLLLLKAENTRNRLTKQGLMENITEQMLRQFMKDAYRQIDQISRRVLEGEVIPHEEKVFSLYERHTEWIQKGKAKAPVELGKRVCILEDQFGFILHHKVMKNEVDTVVAVPMVKEAQQRFSTLSICSFDKGFYSPENKAALGILLDQVVLPKKGRLTADEKMLASTSEYQRLRYQHAAVESGINALEIHGLDRCLDHGIIGFERYVGLAVVARNIQQIGSILHCRKKHKKLRQKNV